MNIFHVFAFSDLTLLVGSQEEHPVRKKLSDERVKRADDGPADATVTPHLLLN